MRLKFLSGAALVAALGVAMLPGSALPVAQISPRSAESADFDSRSGTIAPTRAQRAHASKIKAKVSWGQFGTPASVSRCGKFLARGVRGKTAADAARWYLKRHKALFGLRSVDGLRLESANRLVGSKGSCRQLPAGLRTRDVEGGLVTVGLTGSKTRLEHRVHLVVADARPGAVGLRQALGRRRWLRRQARGADPDHRRTSSGARTLAAGRSSASAGVRATSWFGSSRSRLSAGRRPGVRDRRRRPEARAVAASGRSSTPQRAGFWPARTSSSTPRARASWRSSRSRSAANCPRPTAPASRRARSRSAPATARSTASSAATVPTNDLVLELWKDGVAARSRGHAVLAGAVPLRADRRRARGQLRRSRSATSPTAAGWACAADVHRHATGDDSPAPPPYLARWKTFPANPPLYTVNQATRGTSPTPTRVRRGAGERSQAATASIGNLASRGPWDHDHKLNAPTLTTRGNNAKSATSWTNDLLPSAPQYMPTSVDSGLQLPVDERLEQRPLRADPVGAPGDDLGRLRSDGQPVRRPQPDARLVVLPGLHRAELERSGLQLRPDRAAAGERPDHRQRPVRARSGGSARDNANMITLPDGVGLDHEHVLLAAARRARSTPRASTATTTWASSATSTAT